MQREEFEQSVRDEYAMLLRLVRSRVRDEEHSKDVLQNALAKAWRKRHQFRGESNLGGWLARIVVQHIIRDRRDERRRHELAHFLPLVEEYSHGPNALASLESSPDSTDVMRDLEKALKDFSLDEQAAIRLYLLEEWPQADIETKTGISPDAQTRLMRRLRPYMADYRDGGKA